MGTTRSAAEVAPPQVGDPAPLFVAKTLRRGDWWLSSAAGRFTVLCFPGPAAVAVPEVDGVDVVWVVRDRAAAAGLAGEVVLDEDGRITQRYGFDGPASVVLDRGLRVVDVVTEADPRRHAGEVTEALGILPTLPDPGAPVLVVPRVLEPDLCRLLISAYDRAGGTDSGFVRSDAGGRTVPVVDHSHKRRKDLVLTDRELRRGVKERVERRLSPELRKAFQFTATRIERYIVACYDSADGGHFRPHRDNTTKGTAHRKFAVSINLNDDFDGGELRFPEFGPRTYRPTVGGAVVFSCSLLHEATAVTAGRRYCTLPFLYDEAGEELRRSNLRFVDLDTAAPDMP